MALSTLTEIVAAVVVHSSAAAMCHFGVSLEPAQVERAQPAPPRVIARTPRKMEKVSTDPAPETRRLPVARA